MQFHRSLDSLFSDASHLRVLRTLWKASPQGMTGREAAARAHVSTAHTARVLKDLEEVGVAASQAAGRALLWTWNPDHVWAVPLRRLFSEESRLPAGLERDVSRILRGLPIERAALFGSVARGQERSDSDIDLFVETVDEAAAETVRIRLLERRSGLWKKYGNPLSPIIMTTPEVRRSPRSKMLQAVRQQGISLEL